MALSTVIQIFAACIGVLGALFFAIAIMRQSVSTMADLAGTYFDWNPHFVSALAAQKADYLLGGVLIGLSFVLQLFSFAFTPNDRALLWISVPATAVAFFILQFVSKKLAEQFEIQILARLKDKCEESKRALETRKQAAAGRKMGDT